MGERLGRECARAAPADWDEIRELVRRFALSRLRDSEAAEEVAQEVLLRAWRARRAMRSASSRDAWLVAVTANEVRRLVDRRARADARVRAVAAAMEREPVVVDPAEPIVDRGVVRAALKRLAPVDRKLLVLHYVGDMALGAIAEQVGMPLGTVKARVFRARSRLAEDLMP